MAGLGAILRILGLPLCIFLGMLAFYEGLPFARDFPLVDRIPVLRELVAGRVQTERAKAAADARQGYVLHVEKVAAEQKLAEIQRQLLAAQFSIKSFRARLDADAKADAEREREQDNEILAYEIRLSQANRRCTLDDDDLSTIMRR